MSLFDEQDQEDPLSLLGSRISQTRDAAQLGGAVPPVSSMPMVAPPISNPAPGWQGGMHGLFDKLEEGVKSHIANIGENLMPTPSALKGLLSPDDVSAARRQGLLNFGIALSQGTGENPLQSLGRGLKAAQDGFADHVGGVIEQRKTAEAEQQRQVLIAQQQAQLKSRAQIAQAFAAKPNETAAETDTRLRKMAVAYADAQDAPMAEKIGTLLKSLQAPATPAPHTINAGNKMITIGPDGKTLREDAVSENPAQVARDKAAAARAAGVDARAQAANDRFEASQKAGLMRQQNVIVHDFNKIRDEYMAAETGYGVLKAAKASPNNFMQPMTALDALARMLNPKGAVRVGTLQILKAQGSLGNRLERNWTMLTEGKWPDGMQKEVFDMADKIMQEHTEDFEKLRDETIERGDAQGVDVRALLHKSQKIETTKKASTGKLGTFK